MPGKVMSFTSVEENKKYYARAGEPAEYLYNYKYLPQKPIVLPVKNTKRILAIKGRGGGL
jgi:hypothetical protein